VAVEGVSDRVRVTLTWAGGQQTHHEVTRPVGRYEQTADFDRLMARVRELRATGLSFAAIAGHLNAEGYRPPKGAERFDGDMVGRILKRRTPGWTPQARNRKGVLEKDEWFVVDLARKLGIPKNTLHAWIRRGWVRHRHLTGYRAPCVCWADADELRRLQGLRQTPHSWWDPVLPEELTVPKPRAEDRHSNSQSGETCRSDRNLG
jgi:transposase-like protein